jgi:hypothetical protein
MIRSRGAKGRASVTISLDPRVGAKATAVCGEAVCGEAVCGEAVCGEWNAGNGWKRDQYELTG